MLRNWFLVLLIICPVGCARDQNAATTRSSEQAFQLGREAFERKNYDEATRHLEAALLQQGLNADLTAEALMMRAKSNIQLGRPTEALRDLDEVSKGPAPREDVLAAKGDVAILQGDLEEARRLYSKAQKLNPAVKLPEKL
jgi:predicted negative regulator of RcsB-dependent stress response